MKYTNSKIPRSFPPFEVIHSENECREIMQANDWSPRDLYRTLATLARRSPAKATRKALSGCER